MPKISQEEIIKSFAELADDFFCDLLLVKGQPIVNIEPIVSGSIPFLHAHTLELSVKTMALHLDIDLVYPNGKGMSHDIKSMYEKISKTHADILGLLPDEDQYRNAKLLFFDSNDEANALFIPNPEDINILELSFYIENVMNLKYGFTKEFIRLSGFNIHTNQVNPKFLALFKYCRDFYKTDELNDRFQRRVISIAGSNDQIMNFINHLIL